MKIYLQTSSLVIVEKPAEVLSVPGRFPEKDQRPVLGKLLEKELECQIYPVHRLDYEVSGIMIYALTARAHKILNRGFENKLITKIYQALTDRPSEIPRGEKQTWECKILRGKKRSFESPAGDIAVTQAFKVEEQGPQSLWKLFPITGRSHQLRFEMYRHQIPILGDTLYGGTPWGHPGIALKALQLDFSRFLEREELELPRTIDSTTDPLAF
ncbi:MAG: pseudouridine synthase family protein [Pseudobdellovibrionaceae bacterium]